MEIYLLVVRWAGQLALTRRLRRRSLTEHYLTFPEGMLGDSNSGFFNPDTRRNFYQAFGVVPEQVLDLGPIDIEGEGLKVLLIETRDVVAEDGLLLYRAPLMPVEWYWEMSSAEQKGLDGLVQERELTDVVALAALHLLELHDRRPKQDPHPGQPCVPECTYHTEGK